MIDLDPASLSTKNIYDILVGTIQPRPIGLISTMSQSGVANLAPFSFFMAGGANPPSLVFSVNLNVEGQEKDSLRNVRATQEFVANILTREMADSMNLSSASLPPQASEWDLTVFKQVPSDVVAPPRVAESPAQFECRLFQVIDHGGGPSSARYVIGEVVRIHLADELWQDGIFQAGSLRPISRLGGPEYLDTALLEIFELERPK